MHKDEIPPLFKSGFDACRFAYAYSSQQYAMTAMAKIMRGESVGNGKGLVGLDGAAVAGTVKRHVEALADEHHAAIMARHELVRDHAMMAVGALVQFVVPALGTGAHHRRMVVALICRYFQIPDENGRQIMLASLCDRYGLSSDTMTRRKSAAFRRLREIESRAQSTIDEDLQEAGIVG